jgi:hypothetical protein
MNKNSSIKSFCKNVAKKNQNKEVSRTLHDIFLTRLPLSTKIFLLTTICLFACPRQDQEVGRNPYLK